MQCNPPDQHHHSSQSAPARQHGRQHSAEKERAMDVAVALPYLPSEFFDFLTFDPLYESNRLWRRARGPGLGKGKKPAGFIPWTCLDLPTVVLAGMLAACPLPLVGWIMEGHDGNPSLQPSFLVLLGC